MDKREQVPEIAQLIDEQDVVQYLKQNPYFFIRNVSLAEHIKVPHAVQEAISLPELVMSRQRQKSKSRTGHPLYGGTSSRKWAAVR